MEQILIIPESKEISKTLKVNFDIKPYIEKAPQIKNSTEQLQINEHLKIIKGEIRRIDAERKEFTGPLNIFIDKIIASANLLLNPLKRAEDNIKNSLTNWEISERKRIAAENEKLRVEAEEKARKEKEALEKKAEKARQSGKIEKAESLLEQAAEAYASPVIAPIVLKSSAPGLSFSDKWSAEVIDDKLIPREYLIVNQSALDDAAQRTAGKIEIPGVKINHRLVPASRKN